MPASLPPCLANGGQPIRSERQQSDGLAPGQRQANARPATEATDMVGVDMDQCTGGAFRAARRLRLSAAMRSCSVRLCVLRGRLVRLQQGQFGIRCQILSVRFRTDGPSTIPRKPCPSRPRPPGNAFARPLAPKVVRSGSRSQAAASPSLSPSRSPDPATPSARGRAHRHLPPLHAETKLP